MYVCTYMYIHTCSAVPVSDSPQGGPQDLPKVDPKGLRGAPKYTCTHIHMYTHSQVVRCEIWPARQSEQDKGDTWGTFGTK